MGQLATPLAFSTLPTFQQTSKKLWQDPICPKWPHSIGQLKRTPSPELLDLQEVAPVTGSMLTLSGDGIHFRPSAVRRKRSERP